MVGIAEIAFKSPLFILQMKLNYIDNLVGSLLRVTVMSIHLHATQLFSEYLSHVKLSHERVSIGYSLSVCSFLLCK